MMIRTALILISLFVLAGCSNSTRWFQTVTVEVETPGGIVSAASTYEVRLATSTALYESILRKKGFGYAIKGQATVLTLSSGHMVVALLHGNGSPASEPGKNGFEYLTANDVTYPEIDDTFLEMIGDIAPGTRAEIAPRDWPLIVVYQPGASITQFDAVSGVDGPSLASLIAEGFRLKSITVEKSSGPASAITIDQIFPCLADDDWRACRLNVFKGKYNTPRSVWRRESFLRRDVS